ncbi:acetate/propionate family kinase [Mucilaginibacter paludis]|uniref:Acetate kinase n=1 Tax=Mucilaginibacter paludis DSM 18603 TaxID=714943 RepID=H1Y9J1_9SPHI|nr:acetate kinase [Mucilaginibacter paludis]EHQ29996.1 Acetate kinase [Mucilaginibacter paludis DSM 18603]
MNIFVVNSGSSSIKYQFFKMPSVQPVCTGLVERIGQPTAAIIHKVNVNGAEQTVQLSLYLADHEAGMLEIEKLLTDAAIGVIQNPDEIEAVGHRIVHGGEHLSQPTIITDAVKEEIKRIFPLAPLHNPGHYQGIQIAQKLFAKAVHIAVFDTAFHQTLPEKAYRYAIPQSYYDDYGIRVYGFHGISHQYVSGQAAQYLNKPDAKIITIHLGNGCSMSAVKDGKCIDTSMGLTPLDGLIMGTRCGDIDPSVLTFLMQNTGCDGDQLSNLLNKQSGMLGLTGCSDMRDIKALMDSGDTNARLAYDMYAYRIKKYIGAYTAVLNGLDAIVFTAGVGENAALVRQMVCHDMDYLGIRLDEAENEIRRSTTHEINTADSRVKILVIPTNEELEISNQCVELMQNVVCC